MRIVQACGWYFPDRLGGTEIYVNGLSRRLRRLGHAVEVVAPDPGAAAPRTYEHDGIVVRRFPIAQPLTRDEAQGRSLVRGSEWFRDWIAREAPDVTHFHTLVPGLELPEVEAAKQSGSRVIATTHASSLGHICARGTLMHWGETACDGVLGVAKCAACDLQKRGLSRSLAGVMALVPPAAGELARLWPGRVGTAFGMTAAIAFNRTRQRELIATVDRFVLLTRAAAEIVERNGAPAAKLALNRLGIDRDVRPKPAATATGRPVRVGYVGRFDAIKGVSDLARAVAALPTDLPIAVDIRGPADTPDDRATLGAVEAMLRDCRRVTIGPALPPADVPAHLAGLDVLCCPSVCLEGGPTVAIEAHAAGTPVVGTRIGGLAEIVTDGVNGALVAPGDWSALSGLLETIASDPAGTVDRWRRALPPPRTMDEVTADYLELYAA